MLKEMAIEQKALKAKRKTGTITWNPDLYAWGERKTPIPQIQYDSWQAASKVQSNALRITAILNLYHEQRGSSYRHNVQASRKYAYDYLMKEVLANCEKLKIMEDIK